MYSRDVRPKWWQLYLVMPLLLLLFAMDNRLKLSVRGHQAVQIGIVLLVYGLVRLWLKANSSALTKADYRQYYGDVRVMRIPSPRLPDSNEDGKPMFRLSETEIKGVLDSTFEMDYIDAEFLPMNEILHELKKE